MCLIGVVPKGVEFPYDKFEIAYNRNSDGFGVMFSKGDGVHVHRILPNSWEDVKKVWERYQKKDVDLAFHLRMKTHGYVDKANVHPYRVLSKAGGDASDLYMMHNGVLSGFTGQAKEKSDTWHLIEEWLRPLFLNYGVSLLGEGAFQEMLGDYIGTGNKLVFLDGAGKYTIINQRNGNDKYVPGVWVSNTYSFNKPPVTTTYTSGQSAGYTKPTAGTPPSPSAVAEASVETVSTTRPSEFKSGLRSWGWPWESKAVASVKPEETKPGFSTGTGELWSFLKGKGIKEVFEFTVNSPEDAADMLYEASNDY